MALPGDALSVVPAPAPLLDPDAQGRAARRVDYERAGVALSDPSEGIDAYTWRARLDGNDVKIGREPYATETVYLSAAGITELSLAFDQNMRPLVAYVQLGQARLRWYDATLPGETTIDLPVDAKSPFLTFDDKRAESVTSGLSDVLLFYVRANRLCYRQQRDRFLTERTLAWFEGSSVTIKKAGMNNGLRMQVELVGMSATMAAGAVLASWREAAYLASVTSIADLMPDDVATGDLLYAVLMHRSAATPPAGWTLLTSAACLEGATTQTLSVFKKDTAAPADAGVSATFSQSASGRMGLLYFCVRASSGALSYLGAASSVVDDTATNTVTAPIAAAAGTELVMTLATTVNATADVTFPSIAAGMSIISGQASQTRLGAAYQRRTVGQTNAGRFTFNNGSPVNNGLAALTLRFTTV